MFEDYTESSKATHETLTEKCSYKVKNRIWQTVMVGNIMQPLARNKTKTCK